MWVVTVLKASLQVIRQGGSASEMRRRGWNPEELVGQFWITCSYRRGLATWLTWGLAKDKILAPTCVGMLNCWSIHQRAWAGVVFRRKMCGCREKLGSLAVFQLALEEHQGARGCPACPPLWPGCPQQWQVCLSSRRCPQWASCCCMWRQSESMT